MKSLHHKKQLAAKILKTSAKKIWFAVDKLQDIKEAITRADLRNLVKSHAIEKKSVNGPSRVRARKRHEQKVKGRRRGLGKRKGTANARKNGKETWMERIRSQRVYIKSLKEKGKITPQTYRMLYRRCKGGYFRSKRHINLYLTEKELFVK